MVDYYFESLRVGTGERQGFSGGGDNLGNKNAAAGSQRMETT